MDELVIVVVVVLLLLLLSVRICLLYSGFLHADGGHRGNNTSRWCIRRRGAQQAVPGRTAGPAPVVIVIAVGLLLLLFFFRLDFGVVGNDCC
jgi:hypothetical protein